MKHRVLSLISLCKKAGFLVTGQELVKKTALNNPFGTVFICKDVSERTKSNLESFCKENNINCLDVFLSKDDIYEKVGKYAGVFYISNKSLCSKIKSLIF